MMLKIVVIDDEPKARETIINIIGLGPSNVSVVGEAEDVISGYDVISRLKPDVVLLDINLPDGTGFDLLKKFDSIFFKIIFITAHEEYAVRAFRFSALDYILKPVTAGNLFLALEKANEVIQKEETEMKLSAFLENLNKIKKIVLKTAESIHIINIDDIIHCVSDVNYTTFHMLNGDELLVSKPLKVYAGMLESMGFYRTHQSHLVNLNHILRYDKMEGGHLVMVDESIVPVSSRKKDELFSMFERM